MELVAQLIMENFVVFLIAILAILGLYWTYVTFVSEVLKHDCDCSNDVMKD